MTYTGLDEIRACFTGLFGTLRDLSTLAAPVVEVEEGPDHTAQVPQVIVEAAPAKMVFLLWSCSGCRFQSCHDTFHFHGDNKITRQNIALIYTK